MNIPHVGAREKSCPNPEPHPPHLVFHMIEGPVDLSYGCPGVPEEPTFEWPCDRRDAHHAHLTHCLDHPPENEQPFARCWNCVECIGVAAHPATQIGGAFKRY